MIQEQKLKKISGKRFERELRKNAAPAEKKFRFLLRLMKKEFGLKFKVQFQKNWFEYNGFFISDFYFPDTNYTVELDGKSHDSKKQKDQDKRKSEFLLLRGIKTVRFTNQEVYVMSTETLFRQLALKSVI